MPITDTTSPDRQLASASRLDCSPLTVTASTGEQRLGVAALVDGVGELEELAQPDAVRL